MTEVVRYGYQLRPGKTAGAALLAEWGRCRFLWNEAVHQYKSGNKPTFCSLSKLLTAARANNKWLREGSQVAQQQTLRNFALALRHSFVVKGRGRPRAKKQKTTLPSLEYSTRGFSVVGGRLRLAGGIVIPVVWSRALPSDPTSVRVYQDSLGHWYASFVVRREGTDAPTAHDSIGIDWGVRKTASTTNPDFDLPYRGYRKQCAAALAKAQRKMSRRRGPRGSTQSKGYQRAKREAARLQKKASRQNQHAARQWAKRVVDRHALIAVEDFEPRFLARSTMARKAADAAIGAAKRELIERGVRAGRRVVLVPPAYTTMTCAECLTRAKQRLGLGLRTFSCDACGHVADRDVNAARNILSAVERDRAGADDIRHAITSKVVGCGLSQKSPDRRGSVNRPPPVGWLAGRGSRRPAR
jgi:putative transposase